MTKKAFEMFRSIEDVKLSDVLIAEKAYNFASRRAAETLRGAAQAAADIGDLRVYMVMTSLANYIEFDELPPEAKELIDG
jgi:hypothetical protein